MKNCNECSKLFFSGYDLARHFNSVHKNITYDCTTCSKTFKSKVGLTYHERGHANNFRFLYPYCGKGFNYNGDFEGHKAGHDGEKNFECSKCQKKFQYKSSRNVHQGLCGKKKSDCAYKCDTCGKVFKSLKYLKEHVKSHTNPDRYQCTVYGNFYQNRSGLYKHSQNTGH
ncbi:KRAB [Mytilus coruscus]|uniref:KRAB n=1 Tax=Mytilus coruscus TaxID=42192 RepID=A0A6J8C2G0_MYTCO|nr:KRAB [Mytilus coruscus]